MQVSPQDGLVRRAFAAALRAELGEFYRMLAELDASVAAAASPTDAPASSSLPRWTLRRLLVWASEPLIRMRCVAELAEACAGLHGAAIASQLHLHHARGDPSTRGLVGRVLAASCRPLVALALQWLTQGQAEQPPTPQQLNDAPGPDAPPAPPPPEFFVRVDPSRAAVEDIWEHRFTLEPAAVPLFLSRATAAALFEAGKSVHFMLAACGDAEWVAAHVQPAADEVARMMVASAATGGAAAGRPPPPASSPLAQTQAVLAALEGPDLTGSRLLESTLAVVRPLVDARLRHLLVVEHRLEAHLQGIQRYVLLGQVRRRNAARAGEAESEAPAVRVSRMRQRVHPSAAPLRRATLSRRFSRPSPPSSATPRRRLHSPCPPSTARSSPRFGRATRSTTTGTRSRAWASAC